MCCFNTSRKEKRRRLRRFFPDFPGCVFGGKTLDQALENAREGIIFHIEGLLQAGETLPEPTYLEDIKKNPHLPTGQLKRLNITMDTGLLAEIDQAVKSGRVAEKTVQNF